MDEYIKREAALTALSMAFANEAFDECEEETVKKCMRVLHRVPTADVASVVLPCKIGDTVYSKDGKAAEIEGFYLDKRSINAEVSFECNYDCKYCAFNSWHTEHSGENSCDGEYGTSMVSIEQFGKTIFLSREEAEAALNRGGE